MVRGDETMPPCSSCSRKPTPAAPAAGASIMRSAAMIAVVIVLSKLAGFARDIVMAQKYGATTVSDAYFYAYQIPSLALILLGGVGGPFHSAVVAVFAKLIPDFDTKPPELVNKLYSTFLTGTVLFFTVLGILFFVFSHQIMGLIISGGSDELVSLAARHLRVMTPIFIIGGIAGIFYGLLVTYKHFILPNFSPAILSFVIIATLLFTKHDSTGIVLACATCAGALCQILVLYPSVRKIGFRFKPNFNFFNNPENRNICGGVELNGRAAARVCGYVFCIGNP